MSDKTIFVALIQEYNGQLPGALIDLHRAKKFAESQGMVFMCACDIIDPEYPKGAMDLISKGEVATGLYDLVDDFGNQADLVSDGRQLRDWFSSLPATERMIFYYSGHGQKDDFRLSNGSLFPKSELVSNLKALSQKLTMIVDCCHAGTLSQSFIRRDKSWHLDMINPSPVRTIVLSASDDKTPSWSTRSESLFSKRIFQLLSQGVADIDQLRQLLIEQLTSDLGSAPDIVFSSSHASIKSVLQ